MLNAATAVLNAAERLCTRVRYDTLHIQGALPISAALCETLKLALLGDGINR